MGAEKAQYQTEAQVEIALVKGYFCIRLGGPRLIWGVKAVGRNVADSKMTSVLAAVDE